MEEKRWPVAAGSGGRGGGCGEIVYAGVIAEAADKRPEMFCAWTRLSSVPLWAQGGRGAAHVKQQKGVGRRRRGGGGTGGGGETKWKEEKEVR
jgi:hypothetical protein